MVGAPYEAAAPFSPKVNAVICCVVVTKISVPSGVSVFSGAVIVPVANVPAGWISAQIPCDTGVGIEILKPVPGV